jgi:predicted phosphoribosyltransferase
MGAIATGDVLVLNEDVVQALRIPPSVIQNAVAREQPELDRRDRLYRGDRPPPDGRGCTVILLDDGLATGATMRAAAAALMAQRPRRLIVAVPVAPPSTCRALRAEVDEVVSLVTPEGFRSVGEWYRDFGQTTDDEVRRLLGAAGAVAG